MTLLFLSDRVIDIKKKSCKDDEEELESNDSEGFISLQSSQDSCSISTATSNSEDDFDMEPLSHRIQYLSSSDDDDDFSKKPFGTSVSFHRFL